MPYPFVLRTQISPCSVFQDLCLNAIFRHSYDIQFLTYKPRMVSPARVRNEGLPENRATEVGRWRKPKIRVSFVKAGEEQILFAFDSVLSVKENISRIAMKHHIWLVMIWDQVGQ